VEATDDARHFDSVDIEAMTARRYARRACRYADSSKKRAGCFELIESEEILLNVARTLLISNHRYMIPHRYISYRYILRSYSGTTSRDFLMKRGSFGDNNESAKVSESGVATIVETIDADDD